MSRLQAAGDEWCSPGLSFRGQFSLTSLSMIIDDDSMIHFSPMVEENLVFSEKEISVY